MDENVLFKTPQAAKSPPDAPEDPKENPQAPSVAAPVTPPAQSPIAAFAKPLPKPHRIATSADEVLPPPPPPPVKRSNPFGKLILAVVAVILVTILVIILLPKKSNQNAKLVWWGLWEDSRVVQPIIADFEKEHPGITVEYSKQDPNQYRERLITRVNNGTGPDIFRFHNTWYPMLTDILLPLSSDVITLEDFKKNYFPVMQTDLVHNGGIYGIPLSADSLSLFINTDLLTAAGIEPPKNWDEFVKAAKLMTVKDENGKIKTSGAALGTYPNITHAPDIIAMLFAQQGVEMNKFPTYGSYESDAMNFYASFAQGEQNTWNNTLDDSILLFSKGNVAMYFGYSWDIFAIQKLNKDLPFKVYPVPSLYKKNMTIASYWVEGVSAKSAHQQAAFLFMQYLSKKETAQKLYSEEAKTRAFGEPYARRDLTESLKSNSLVYPFVSQLSQSQSSFFASDTHDGEGGLNAMSNTYLENASNSIINDGTSADSAVGQLVDGIGQVLAKYGIQ